MSHTEHFKYLVAQSKLLNRITKTKYSKKLTATDKKLLGGSKLNTQDDTTLQAIAKYMYADGSADWLEIAENFIDYTTEQKRKFHYSLQSDDRFPFKMGFKVFVDLMETVLFEYIVLWDVQAREQANRTLVRGKYAVWIISQLYSGEHRSGAYLRNTWYRDEDTSGSSPTTVKNRVAQAMLTLERKGYIIYVERYTFTYYRISEHITQVDDKYYYRKVLEL